jgi:hypothetical protein
MKRRRHALLLEELAQRKKGIALILESGDEDIEVDIVQQDYSPVPHFLENVLRTVLCGGAEPYPPLSGCQFGAASSTLS